MCTQCKMPVTNANILRQEELNAWPHLNSVEIPVIDADLELWIGTNASVMLSGKQQGWTTLCCENPTWMGC